MSRANIITVITSKLDVSRIISITLVASYLKATNTFADSCSICLQLVTTFPSYNLAKLSIVNYVHSMCKQYIGSLLHISIVTNKLGRKKW